MKKIPVKNYIKVFILFLLTFVIVLVLANNYEKKVQYERSNDDIINFLPSVKYEELSSYLMEHRDGYIYIASSLDVSLDSFKKEFKDYLLEEELENYFIYLDSSTYSDNDYTALRENIFSSDLQNTKIVVPNIFAVKNGEIVAVLYDDDHSIEIDDVKSFVNNYQVTND